MNTIFIIDTYSQYLPTSVKELARYIFSLNDILYAIYEVELEWGQINMERPIEEEHIPDFYYFNSYEEALDFVKQLKKINS